MFSRNHLFHLFYCSKCITLHAEFTTDLVGSVEDLSVHRVDVCVGEMHLFAAEADDGVSEWGKVLSSHCLVEAVHQHWDLAHQVDIAWCMLDDEDNIGGARQVRRPLQLYRLHLIERPSSARNLAVHCHTHPQLALVNQQALLVHRNRAMCFASQNLVKWCTNRSRLYEKFNEKRLAIGERLSNTFKVIAISAIK